MTMEKEKKKERGFFGKLVVGLLTLLAWIGVMAMAMSVLSSYVDPNQFVWASFFGLAFWEILLFNVIILVLLLLMWSRRVWVAVLALAIAVPGFLRSFSYGKPQEGGDLRVMSYNVLIFKDQYNEDKKPLDVAYSIANMVREQHPDVLCVQEFGMFMPKTGLRECVRLYGEMLDMPYHYYHRKDYYGGNVIFSIHPLHPVEDETHFGKENEYGSVVEVDAGDKGKFLVLCSHLASYKLTKEEVTAFSEPGNTRQEIQEYGKSIVVKLKDAYKRRSQQVHQMLEDIPHDGRPILLCGDFNDTPLSYTYHHIKKAGFTDSFVVAGRGIGHTYAGKLPLLRIDYIWGNEWIKPLKFKRLKYKGSDHYPIMMEFALDHGV